MAAAAHILIAGRKTPLKPIEAYLRFLRRPIRAQDVGGYDHERRRLHNAIFNAAGLPDLGNQYETTSARQIGYNVCASFGWREKGDTHMYRKDGQVIEVDVTAYGYFNEALEILLSRALACPDCHTTLSRDQTCRECGKKACGEDHVRTLRKMAQEQQEER